MGRHILNFILMVVSVSPIVSQKVIYEGPARWLNDSSALERFEYDIRDSAMVPDGQYEVKLKKDFAEGGIHELTYFKGNYHEGRLEGAVNIFMYNINFNIIEFDSLQVQSEKTGEKMSISGQYSAGVPSGKWRFTCYNMDNPRDSIILQYDTGSKKMQYADGKIRFQGSLNEMHYFDGDWKWYFHNGNTVIYHYRQGILTEISHSGDTTVNDILRREKILFEKADSIVPSPAATRWTSVFGEEGVVTQIQKPVGENLIRGLKAYNFAENQMTDLQNFILPEIRGTARIYHSVSDESRQELQRKISILHSQDSILTKKTELPVFQLRRDNDSAVDSLLHISGKFLQDNRAAAEEIRKFLSDSVRTISPFVLHFGSDSTFSSHESIAGFLKSRADQRTVLFENLVNILEEEQEVLRMRGTLAELEEEWYYMIQAVETQYKPEEFNFFAMEIYKRFLVDDFEEKKRAYSEIKPLRARKSFLQNTISYTRFYYGFFRDSLYQPIQAVESELMEAYTQYLYNPYMGVYNVEVVVKKRFLEKIIEVFWPNHLTTLKNAVSGDDFIMKYEETQLLKSMLVHFAERKEAEAKRLERRVRKMKKAEDMSMALKEYLENNYHPKTDVFEES